MSMRDSGEWISRLPGPAALAVAVGFAIPFCIPGTSRAEGAAGEAPRNTVVTLQSGSETQGNPDVTPGIASEDSLAKAVDAVLARAYGPDDTAGLLPKLGRKLQWGEKDERLIEAEAVLLWDRGEWPGALADLRKLSHPRPEAMALTGECLLRNDEQYEAAAWFLKAARAFPAADTAAPALYRKYLAVRPENAKVELELAARLEAQKRYLEASQIYLRHLDSLPGDAGTVVRVGTILSGLGKTQQALDLFVKARKTNPQDHELCLRTALANEALGQKSEAAADLADAWESVTADTISLNHAVALLESLGPAGDEALKTLLGRAVAREADAHALHFKFAEICLRDGDADAAYMHLVLALKASPDNPAYLARLPEAIQSDDQIREFFPYLKTTYETRGADLRLLQLVARGFSLAGDKDGACRAWSQLYAVAPKTVQGRRAVVLALAGCDDSDSVSLAGGLAGLLPPDSVDADVLRLGVRAAAQDKDFGKAAELARRLAQQPGQTDFALQTAKDLLRGGHAPEAKSVLSELAKKTPTPETYLLLGRILVDEKDCPQATDPLEAAAEAYPEAGRLLGRCLVELKDFQGAARVYEGLWSKQGGKEDLIALAAAYHAAGFDPKEKEVLAQIVDRGWAGEPEKLRLGALLIQQGDSAQAEMVFTELLRGRNSLPAGPAWADGAFFLGNRQVTSGRIDRAVKTLVLAIKADSTRGASWKLLGDCLAAKHLWKEALAAYASGASVDRQNPELAQAELAAAKKAGDKQALVQAYLDAARQDTADTEALEFLAGHFQSAREYRDAACYYGKLTRARPNDAQAWENLGNSLALIPDLAAAAEPLQKALDLGAQSDEVFINRARAYRHDGAKDMAASILDFLLNRNPKDYLALLWSAKFAEEDGRQPEAIEFFKKAARQTPPRTAWPELASQGMQEAEASPR